MDEVYEGDLPPVVPDPPQVRRLGWIYVAGCALAPYFAVCGGVVGAPGVAGLAGVAFVSLCFIFEQLKQASLRIGRCDLPLRWYHRGVRTLISSIAIMILVGVVASLIYEGMRT